MIKRFRMIGHCYGNTYDQITKYGFFVQTNEEYAKGNRFISLRIKLIIF